MRRPWPADATADPGHDVEAGAGLSARHAPQPDVIDVEETAGAGSSARGADTMPPDVPVPSARQRLLALVKHRRFTIHFESLGFSFLPGCLQVAGAKVC